MGNEVTPVAIADEQSIPGQQGTPVLAVRNDADVEITDQDGDESRFAVDKTGKIKARDDYALGILLDDQEGNDGVLEFDFQETVVSFWVAAIGDSGLVKVDHYGGTPSASRGIPVEVGGPMPIPEPATVVKVYAPSGTTVTVWGQRRA